MNNISIGQLLAVMATLALVILALPLVGITVGAFVGAIAGYFFPGTVGLVGSAITGGATLPAWQVGAILGFVGAFFRASLSSRSN